MSETNKSLMVIVIATILSSMICIGAFVYVPTLNDMLQGEQGIAGVQGLNGSQGIQGIQGIQGSSGADGINGVDGADGEDFTPVEPVFEIWVYDEGNGYVTFAIKNIGTVDATNVIFNAETTLLSSLIAGHMYREIDIGDTYSCRVPINKNQIVACWVFSKEGGLTSFIP